MTYEEMERAMGFIIEQQAKFSADIDKINEMLARHNEAIVGLLQVSRTLVDHQLAIDQRMTRIEEKMLEMAQAQKNADERLGTLTEKVDAFITFVEKYISRRDGE